MELFFLILLIVIMVSALSSGFPVAFALPGAAVITICLAGLSGYIFAGDSSAYFAIDGPAQWLSAGVTNFRGVYWEVERDTLIAIPLFIFMGIMLQRSKIAEDLLVAMGRLFGPVPGGLGISVVFVGALLAATTGIVGATVVAMGLISLPAMLRSGYSKSLASGTICASGTLGQIIPPSIVLIILADQLASAADQAATIRQANYKALTGEFSMPADYAIQSASAGDMFLGAFLPGMLLVGLYMGYILITALINPKSAPPVPYEGEYNRAFWIGLLLALIPPLALIFAVLGSIILGVATVNQAGAIGAVGATLMAGYRLHDSARRRYWPMLLALLSLLLITAVRAGHPLNIRDIADSAEATRIVAAGIGVIGLTIAVLWSVKRSYKIDNTLFSVMSETAKTTSMVFIILIGAAMLTAAFRGFGGEELVREFLHDLPGGFWGQFVVVMLVIFLLGFFLDFIEIAVVVVPIVAPILLADPQANVTAVWLGVMIGMNIQTSFLTPPFGFALFYLRGVAPPQVKTTDIYKGASVFIGLQLLGLAVVGSFPPLVNYLPARTSLSSDTAPPPVNPRLQQCIEPMTFAAMDADKTQILAALENAKTLDLSYLKSSDLANWEKSLDGIAASYQAKAAVQSAATEVATIVPGYIDLHRSTRKRELEMLGLIASNKSLEKTASSPYETPAAQAAASTSLALNIARIAEIKSLVPEDWEARNAAYRQATAKQKKAQMQFRRQVDKSYQGIAKLSQKVQSVAALQAVQSELFAIEALLGDSQSAIDAIRVLEKQLQEIFEIRELGDALGTVRRDLRKDKREKAKAGYDRALILHAELIDIRSKLKTDLPPIAALERSLKRSIGVRSQSRLDEAQVKEVASCLSVHRDISLAF